MAASGRPWHRAATAVDGAGVHVTSFEEVADELDEAVSKFDGVTAALMQAGQLASEAVELLTVAMEGARHLEAEFHQVVQSWSEVTQTTEELAQAVAAGQQGVERYQRTLREGGSARTSAQPGSPSPPPRVSVPVLSPPAPPLESEWIEQQRAVLPTYVTSGFFRDGEGNSDLVQSGDAASDEVREIAGHVAGLGLIRPGSTPWVASHVEAKVAWRMRRATVEHVQRAELVVNNVICRGDLACEELLPDILLPGQTLVVHDLNGTHTFHGRTSRELHA